MAIQGGSYAQFTCTAMGEVSALSALPSADSAAGLTRAVKGLSYAAAEGQVVAVTADHNFCCYAM